VREGRVELRPIERVEGDDGPEDWIQEPVDQLLPDVAVLLDGTIEALAPKAEGKPELRAALDVLTEARGKLSGV
jgi:hypothetical protein